MVGAGGGRALDAAKGVALRANLSVVTVPTVASTDAPASHGIAIYNEAHQVVRVEQLPRSPAVVIVDTEIIARARVRYLAAGIGDALSKLIEAKACVASQARNRHGTRPLLAGMAMAQHCEAFAASQSTEAFARAVAEKMMAVPHIRHQAKPVTLAGLEAAIRLTALGTKVS